MLLPEGFDPGVCPPQALTVPAYWFGIVEHRVLVVDGQDGTTIPRGLSAPYPAPVAGQPIFLGMLQASACFAVMLQAVPAGFTALGLREAFECLPGALCAVAGVAVQLVDWERSHRYCGVCATPMVRASEDRAMRCPHCQHACYPRVAPAVMVRVLRDEAILLARAPRFPEGMYSVLAGFVEPGETLEQTIHREVHEEVGVRVENLRYLASQSWPFPHSLMIAFSADYRSGEIRVDGEEIEAADWFRPDCLPRLPGKISIARRLIDDYLGRFAE